MLEIYARDGFVHLPVLDVNPRAHLRTPSSVFYPSLV